MISIMRPSPIIKWLGLGNQMIAGLILTGIGLSGTLSILFIWVKKGGLRTSRELKPRSQVPEREHYEIASSLGQYGYRGPETLAIIARLEEVLAKGVRSQIIQHGRTFPWQVDWVDASHFAVLGVGLAAESAKVKNEKRFIFNLEILIDATSQYFQWFMNEECNHLIWEFPWYRGQAYEAFLSIAVRHTFKQTFSLEAAQAFIERFISNIVIVKKYGPRHTEEVKTEYYDYDTAGDIDHVGLNFYPVYEEGDYNYLDMSATLEKTLREEGITH